MTGTDLPTPPPSPGGVFHRLVRSLSNRAGVKTSKHPPSPTADNNPSTITVTQLNESPTETHAANALPSKIVKLSAIERFRNLGKNRHVKKYEPEFPPQTWFDEGTDPNAPTAGTGSTGLAVAAAVPLPLSPSQETATGDPLEPPNTEQGNEDPPPEPNFLARKIQELVDLLPPFATPASSRFASSNAVPTVSSPIPEGTNTNVDDATTLETAPPVPPPPPIPESLDARLVKLLSNANVMNGSVSRGRMSVWSALDRMRPGAKNPSEIPPEAGNGKGRERRADDYNKSLLFPQDDENDDRSSIMICSPLMPDLKNLPEVAESEILPYDPDAHNFAYQREKGQDFMDGLEQGLHELWPFSAFGDVKKRNEGQTKAPQSKETPDNDRAQPSATQPPKTPTKHRVWVPSTTKISLQTMWWGYRLYLPPPVLDILNNKQLEAAKRAALLTTALKWLFDNLPVMLLPPQLRPALMVLKRLSPYLSYLGAFIAWSWSAVKGYDKGHGVILTATWILPVALIPGTWEENEWPKDSASVNGIAGGAFHAGPAPSPADYTAVREQPFSSAESRVDVTSRTRGAHADVGDSSQDGPPASKSKFTQRVYNPFSSGQTSNSKNEPKAGYAASDPPVQTQPPSNSRQNTTSKIPPRIDTSAPVASTSKIDPYISTNPSRPLMTHSKSSGNTPSSPEATPKNNVRISNDVPLPVPYRSSGTRPALTSHAKSSSQPSSSSHVRSPDRASSSGAIERTSMSPRKREKMWRGADVQPRTPNERSRSVPGTPSSSGSRTRERERTGRTVDKDAVSPTRSTERRREKNTMWRGATVQPRSSEGASTSPK